MVLYTDIRGDCMDKLDEFLVDIRSKPEQSIKWNTNDISFENGAHQYQQTWTEPEISWSFTTEGDAAYIQYVIAFFNAHKGMLIPFYCDLFRNGNLLKYRFGSATLEPTWHYSPAEGRVGGTIEITLVKLKGQGERWLSYLKE